MFEKFSPDARKAVVTATAEAEGRGDAYVGSEHLLLGVGVARPDLATAIGTSAEPLRDALASLDRSALEAAGVSVTLESPDRRDVKTGHRPFTSGAKEVLKDSLREMIGMESRHIEPEHILLALTVRSAHDPALRVLEVLGLSSDTIRADVRQMMRRSA
jgi:ATP-dependent Clp protease ATP-binding subunit ClpA